MKRPFTSLLLSLGLLVAQPVIAAEDEEGSAEEETAVSATASAPEQKTLAERIPSVTRRVFVKKSRVELTPAVGLSLNDPFYDNVVISGKAAYHVTEWLWVEAGGDFFGALKSAVPVTGGGNPTPPKYNRPKFGAGMDVGFAPLYGKFSLMAEHVIHFDTYVALGAGVIGPTQGSTTFAASLAVGQHCFLNEWMALRLELRDQAYQMARAPTVSKDKVLQNTLSFSLGVSFFVPPTFQHEIL
jgi:outer membrane beta-barrel protein